MLPSVIFLLSLQGANIISNNVWPLQVRREFSSSNCTVSVILQSLHNHLKNDFFSQDNAKIRLEERFDLCKE